MPQTASDRTPVLTIADYLGPENMKYVSRLSVKPRQRSAGFMMGNHKSPDTGTGVEFALHRPYVRGDDVRRLDWNVYGRSERLYIKKFEETTELRGVICLDVSGSMAFQGDPQNRWPSKFEFGCRLAAALSYVLLNQGDSVSLVLFSDGIRESIPLSSNPAQLSRVLSILQEAHADKPQPGREDPSLTGVLHELAERFRKREILFLISDLMEDTEGLMQVLGHLRHGRHEAMLLHTLDPVEMDFPFRGWLRLESLEASDQRHLLESGSFRKAYLEALEEYLAECRHISRMYGMDHLVCRTDRPWREVLFDALAGRREIRGV